MLQPQVPHDRTLHVRLSSAHKQQLSIPGQPSTPHCPPTHMGEDNKALLAPRALSQLLGQACSPRKELVEVAGDDGVIISWLSWPRMETAVKMPGKYNGDAADAVRPLRLGRDGRISRGG